jgi:RNA polymerase sigma factor (TIGR02999 family)
MATLTSQDVTQLLRAWREGDRAALDQLMPLVYPDLRKRARVLMKRENPGHSLQATALVNELFIRLVKSGSIDLNDRNHFINLCATIMRRILIDRARKKPGERVSFPDDLKNSEPRRVDLLDLDKALQELEEVFPRRAEIVEMKFFLGLELSEIAEVLGLKTHNVMDEWRAGRGWLRKRLTDGPNDGYTKRKRD